MSTSTGPNPLRPYYIPPANDYLLDSIQSAAKDTFSKVSTSSSSSSSSSPSSSITSNATSIFTSTARDLLSDLDYSDYISDDAGGNLSPVELAKRMAMGIGKKYISQGVSQPFEVAITSLQVWYIPKKSSKRQRNGIFNGDGGRRGRGGRGMEADDAGSVNSDSDEEPAYFSSDISPPVSPSLRATSSRPSRRVTDRTGYPITTPDVEEIRQPWELHLHKNSHVRDMIKALWSKEGVWGIWKGQNASFIHWMLTQTLESWTSSLLSAILSLPEPTLIADSASTLDSPNPLLSIGVAIAASAITALILSPLDIIKTRLMITPSSSTPRNILPQLRCLGTYSCPRPVLLPTLLHATIPTLILTSRPYILTNKLGIDPAHSPGIFSSLHFVGTMAARFFRLPLETVLRRAQANAPTIEKPEGGPPEKTTIPVGRYAGVVGTMWLIVKEEEGEGGLGGVEGLFRGWRMEVWPEVGLMVLNLLGMGSGQEEGF
ncbi:mitochondrial carrier domain-containing protein [Terfezia claveryi]|nr:mitochondrial carrier domain-containing protein [Terfezia claveryi]